MKKTLEMLIQALLPEPVFPELASPGLLYHKFFHSDYLAFKHHLHVVGARR